MLIAIASLSHRSRKMFSYMTESLWVINLEREIGRGENWKSKPLHLPGFGIRWFSFRNAGFLLYKTTTIGDLGRSLSEGSPEMCFGQVSFPSLWWVWLFSAKKAPHDGISCSHMYGTLLTRVHSEFPGDWVVHPSNTLNTDFTFGHIAAKASLAAKYTSQEFITSFIFKRKGKITENPELLSSLEHSGQLNPSQHTFCRLLLCAGTRDRAVNKTEH